MSLSCEFGSCGNSFSPQDPNNSQNNHISGTINFSVGWQAFWGGISRSVGCALVGVGTGATSFLGISPPTADNGPPSASSVGVVARDAYKVGAPGVMYRLSRSGPLARAAGDLIPGFGQGLLYAQGGLAIHDGGKATYDCASKIE